MAKKGDGVADDKGHEIKVHIKDVAAPGETAPDDSSKPIIVTNRPIMKDTMVKEQTEEGEAAPQKPTLSRSTREAVVQPVSQPEKEAEEPPKEQEAAPQPHTDEKPPEEEPAAPDEESKEQAKKAPTAEEATAAEAAEAKKQAEHDESIEKLVDSKKYALPINAVEKRRSKRVVILGLLLSVLLLLAWADIALDAGILNISGVKPVTHFFSN